MIEFKFLSLKELGRTGEALQAMSASDVESLSAVKQALADGKAQAADYGRRLNDKYGDLRLKRFVVAALGFERICFYAFPD